MFLCFLLSFFAIVGVSAFAGFQYRSCRTSADLTYTISSDGEEIPESWPMTDYERLCNSDAVCEAYMPGSVCGSVWEEYKLDPYEIDNVIENETIFYGIIGFDNFWQSFLTVYQVCTLEGWSNLMYNCADAANYPFTVYIFFPLVILMGSFFTVNVILAQIIDTYFIEQERFKRQQEKHVLRKR